MLSNNLCCFVIDCQVKNVLFVMGGNGVWKYTAYVTLNSVEDVDKAVAKHMHPIGKNLVKG